MNVYDSFLEVALDVPGVDGDDSVVPQYENTYYEPVTPIGIETLLTAPAEVFVVPYYFMKPGSRGKKVKALNRALSHAGYRKWVKFSGTWNPWVTKALKSFQSDHNLNPTGIYGKQTHEKLARFYDAYSIKCLLAVPKVSKEQEKRNDFLAELMYVYNRRWNIVYTQRRPFDTWKPPRGLDCSASGEWACKFANIPSPSGYSGYGWGNTWSQMSKLQSKGRKRPVSQAEIGDFVFYGSGGPTHVAYWVGGGRVWSFGSYPAKILDIYYRGDFLGLYDLMG